MGKKHASQTCKVNLGIAVDNPCRGLHALDFFADHISHADCGKNVRLEPSKSPGVMGPLYLRTALTTISCPFCGAKVKRNIRNQPLEWLLKYAGRKILYCTKCDWHQIVKEGHWERETIAAALTAFIIICFATVYWIIR